MLRMSAEGVTALHGPDQLIFLLEWPINRADRPGEQIMVTSARSLRIAFVAVLSIAGFATSASAGDEGALKAYFEGREVTLRMDMPGSSGGVDIQVDPPRSIDYKKYRDTLKRYGVAINYGESSRITLIKIKGNLIELQLDGGGYGTFGDDTSTSSNIRLLDKTDREKTLEKRIQEETDKARKRAMQRELDELRDHRERDNRILRAKSERIEEAKKERLAEKRLQGGSRFNLRWSSKVPANLAPGDVEKALVEYVDFHSESNARDDRPVPPVDVSAVRKGMLREEAERTFGQPVERSEKREGNVMVTTLTFDIGDGRLTAAFVDDVP